MTRVAPLAFQRPGWLAQGGMICSNEWVLSGMEQRQRVPLLGRRGG